MLGERLCWKPGAQRLQVAPVTPILQAHCPLVWLQVLPVAPIGWHWQAAWGESWGLGAWASATPLSQRRKSRLLSPSWGAPSASASHMEPRAALTPTGLAAGEGLPRVPPEARLAVVAMAPSRMVATALAHTPTLAPGQPEELRVEPAASGVLVAGAG